MSFCINVSPEDNDATFATAKKVHLLQHCPLPSPLKAVKAPEISTFYKVAIKR